MTAPDGSVVWLAEFPGPPAPTDRLDVEQVGAIGVGTVRNPADGSVPSYQLLTPCGLVVLNDAPGTEVGRETVRFLLESMSIDAVGTLDVLLPSGWSVLDIGDSQASYVSQFQVPTDEGTAALRLVQIPDGSFSQLTFGGRQLQPTTLLGGPAFVDTQPNDPNLVSVYWKDGPTVFNASSAELTRDADQAYAASSEVADNPGLTERAIRTSVLAMAMAIELEWDENLVREVGQCGFGQDWGMFRLPDELRNKQTELTSAERQLIAQHPLHTFDLLSKMQNISPAVRLAAAQVHDARPVDLDLADRSPTRGEEPACFRTAGLPLRVDGDVHQSLPGGSGTDETRR